MTWVRTSLQHLLRDRGCRDSLLKGVRKLTYPAAKMSVDISQHVIPNKTEFCLLDCKTAFNGLTTKEKLYAHHISQASWYGGLIVLYQTSPESPGIYLLLIKMLRHQTIDELKDVATGQGLTDDDFQAFLVYAAALFANSGNYKSFGDSKIIPGIPSEKMELLVRNSTAFSKESTDMVALWDQIKGPMYSVTKRESQLGLGQEGVTTYFSANCTLDDASLVKAFMMEKKIELFNTRCLKNDDDTYEIRLASADNCPDGLSILGEYTFTQADKEYKFKVTRGDYSALLNAVKERLATAKEYAANTVQNDMLGKYLEHFQSGDGDAHKDASRFWIKDKGPVVESYIGFIETYRDPVGSRAEFEGFVAMVNREMSAKFTALVNGAETYLPLLPWDKEYEKDKFLQPDFTSLVVLTFAGSGVPAGINIPNYDEIRQSEGFKNVSLGNVLSSSYKSAKSVTFMSQSDVDMLAKWKVPSFEVQVGLHELLGHGSGKNFCKNDDGTYNFDFGKTVNPLNGKLVKSYYEPGENYYSKFPVMCSSYEECRAECVGLHLCLDYDVLKVFGYSGEEADDIIYTNWLNMARAGLLSLEFYSPETKSWRQAHMQARYVILRVMLTAGDLVTITERENEDGRPDLLLTLNRDKITTSGRKVISDFLLKLQVYKATADYEAAKVMFQDDLSSVNDEPGAMFQTWRSTVLDRRVQRRMIVQCNTQLNADSSEVELKEYEASATGLVQSVVDRFTADVSIDAEMDSLWKKDLHYWQ